MGMALMGPPMGPPFGSPVGPPLVPLLVPLWVPPLVPLWVPLWSPFGLPIGPPLVFLLVPLWPPFGPPLVPLLLRLRFLPPPLLLLILLLLLHPPQTPQTQGGRQEGLDESTMVHALPPPSASVPPRGQEPKGGIQRNAIQCDCNANAMRSQSNAMRSHFNAPRLHRCATQAPWSAPPWSARGHSTAAWNRGGLLLLPCGQRRL